MKIGQGDIIEINFKLPEGIFKPHPCLVISNNDINEYEAAYIVVMISGVPRKDNYSYFLEEYMLTKTPKKASQVRCHMITMANYNEVLGTHGRIKKQYLSEIIEKIKSEVVSIDEFPKY